MDDFKEKDDRHLKFESMDIRYRDPEFMGFEQQTMKLELRALHLSVAKLQEQIESQRVEIDSLRKMLDESTKQQNSQDASITQNPPTIQNSSEAEKLKDTQPSKDSPDTDDGWIKISHKKKRKKTRKKKRKRKGKK